jgi:hypothetical protein
MTVPVWARLLGVLLALQTVLLLAGATATGALLFGSADRSLQSRQTLPARPDLVLRLNGFPAACQPGPLQPAGCAASRWTPRLIGTEVRIVPARSNEIVVEQEVEVRAAGAGLARRYLAEAAVQPSTGAGGVTLSVAGWNAWDPRLLQGQNRLTLAVPAQVRVRSGYSGTRGAANPGTAPNVPNAPNAPNAPNGRQGQSIQVAAGVTFPGDASAWQGDVTVDGEVRGDVSVVGGTATINGTVDGSISVWDGTAVVAGGARVGGTVSVVAGSLTIGPGAQVGAVRAWQPLAPVSIYGTVARDVWVVTGGLDVAAGARVAAAVTVWSPPSSVQVDGTVGGDVGVSRGDVRFGPQSGLGGRVRIWNGTCSGPPCGG